MRRAEKGRPVTDEKRECLPSLQALSPFLRTSFPGSAWERTVPEAPPREAEPPRQWVPRQSLGTRESEDRRPTKKENAFLVCKPFRHFLFYQIEIFKPHRQPHQAVCDPLSFPLGRADVAMRRAGRVAACRGGMTERRTERDARGQAHETVHGFAAAR